MRARRHRRSVLGLAVALLASTVPAMGAEEALTTLGGQRLEEGAFAEGVVVAIFMATWSPRCRDIAARAERIEERWGDRAKVVLIDFQEEAETVREFLAGRETVPVYLDRDGVYSKEHAITFLPGLLVLQDGSVAFRGRLGRDPDAVLAQILG